MNILLELSPTLPVESTFGRTDSAAEGIFVGIFEGIFEDSGGAGGMTASIRPWPNAGDFNVSKISLETYCWSTHLPSLVGC